PFDVLFDDAYGQQRVLLEEAKLQRIGDADLFCARLPAPGALTVEPLASRVCPFSTLFTFFSYQACVSNFPPCARGYSRRNSVVIFSGATLKENVVNRSALIMQTNGPIDALPLWGLFVCILVVVLLSVEFGYRLGKYRRSRREEEKEAPLGTMVG